MTKVARAAVGEHEQHADRTGSAICAGLPASRPLGAAAPRRVGEHAGEHRAGRAAEAVRGHDVERVVELGARAR